MDIKFECDKMAHSAITMKIGKSCWTQLPPTTTSSSNNKNVIWLFRKWDLYSFYIQFSRTCQVVYPEKNPETSVISKFLQFSFTFRQALASVLTRILIGNFCFFGVTTKQDWLKISRNWIIVGHCARAVRSSFTSSEWVVSGCRDHPSHLYVSCWS